MSESAADNDTAIVQVPDDDSPVVMVDELVLQRRSGIILKCS